MEWDMEGPERGFEVAKGSTDDLGKGWLLLKE
jgi:hypothetical protein